MSKSLYSYVISEGVLCITDHCGHTNMSVTNNTENVLEEIKKELNANKALGKFSMPDIIIYKDSEDNWDGIEYDGKDVSFYLLFTKDLTEAIKRAKNR